MVSSMLAAFQNASTGLKKFTSEKWRVRVISSTKLLLIVHLLHSPTCPTVLVVVLAFVVLSAVRLRVFPGLILF